MTPDQTIWWLSVVGALLFIGVGFFGARGINARALEGLEARHRGEAKQPDHSGDRIARLEEDAEREAARAAELDRRLVAARTEREGLGRDKRALEESLAEARMNIEPLRRDKRELEVALSEAKRALEAMVRKKDGAEQALADAQYAVESLRRENAEIRRAQHELTRELERPRPNDVTLEKRVNELSLALEVSRPKLAELDRLREENTRLKAAAADVARLREESRRLRIELGASKARLFAQPEQPGPEPTETLEGSAFGRLAQAVARTASARSAAVADDLGFVIAGLGTEQEGLAALSSLLGEVEQRAAQLLPVGPLRRVTLELEHGAGVSVCPITRADTRIWVSALSVGPLPDTAKLRSALEEAARSPAAEKPQARSEDREKGLKA